MKTGFKGIDGLINIEDPQLILLTGTHFIEEFSGDIANNVCFKQGDNKDYDVLEIIRCRKEYVIQRMIINEADVNYRSWYHEGEYTDEELQRIGQAVINLVNAPKRTPTIIEQREVCSYNLKRVVELIEDYANHYADRDDITTLVVVDVLPLSNIEKHIIHTSKRRFRKYIKYRKDQINYLKLIKKFRKISHELKCPILFINNIDLMKKYNTENHTYNYLTKDDIDNIKQVNKYVDKFVILNEDKENNIFNVDVYNAHDKVGTCKLQYDIKCRKFLDYEEQ